MSSVWEPWSGWTRRLGQRTSSFRGSGRGRGESSDEDVGVSGVQQKKEGAGLEKDLRRKLVKHAGQGDFSAKEDWYLKGYWMKMGKGY